MLSPELRDRVISYICGRSDFDALVDWYTPRVFELIDTADSADADVVAAIELCLAEMEDGIRSESETKKYLQSALAEHGVYVNSDLAYSENRHTRG